MPDAIAPRGARRRSRLSSIEPTALISRTLQSCHVTIHTSPRHAHQRQQVAPVADALLRSCNRVCHGHAGISSSSRNSPATDCGCSPSVSSARREWLRRAAMGCPLRVSANPGFHRRGTRRPVVWRRQQQPAVAAEYLGEPGQQPTRLGHAVQHVQRRDEIGGRGGERQRQRIAGPEIHPLTCGQRHGEPPAVVNQPDPPARIADRTVQRTVRQAQ